MAISWASKGSEAAKKFEKEKQQREAKAEANKRMWRFWLKPEEEARVTFVDGDLDENGVLDVISFPQHQIFMNGTWNNHFICTAKQEPCPICESDDNPSMVAVFTIIDHRSIKSGDGTKVYKDQKRLFVAKYDTFKILQNMAGKRGGLSGITMDILRTGNKSASVGNQFDFIEKNTLDDLRKMYPAKDSEGKPYDLFTPAEYEKELQYLTRDQLMELGFGGGPGVGHESTHKDGGPDNANYDDQL